MFKYWYCGAAGECNSIEDQAGFDGSLEGFELWERYFDCDESELKDFSYFCLLNAFGAMVIHGNALDARSLEEAMSKYIEVCAEGGEMLEKNDLLRCLTWMREEKRLHREKYVPVLYVLGTHEMFIMETLLPMRKTGGSALTKIET